MTVSDDDPGLPVVSGDRELQTQVLEDLAAAVNYRRWLSSLALPWLGDDALEIGSGTGDYAAEWAKCGVTITASEAEPQRLAALKTRFADHSNVQVRYIAAPIEESASYSAVVAYNVLEHIEDDVAALISFRELLRPGGVVILLVPAFPFAMSRFDREIGHHRRYTVGSARQALVGAGFEVREARYVNSLGLLAWTVMMKVLRQRPRAGAGLRLYDSLVPLLRRLEEGRRLPFGQSVLVVGAKP